jgi:hypothetical protein
VGLETDFDYLDDLNVTWPLGTDPVSEGDNHVAGLKNAIRSAINNDGTFTSLFLATVEALRLEGAAAKFFLRYLDVLSSLDISTGLRAANNEGGLTLTTDGGITTLAITDDALAALSAVFIAAPESFATYLANELNLLADATGLTVQRNSAGGGTTFVRLRDASSEDLVHLVAVDGAYTGLIQYAEGLPMRFYVRDGGVSRLMIGMDQSIGISLYGPGGELAVSIDGTAQAATQSTRARVVHRDGTRYPVGLNVSPLRQLTASGPLQANDAGKTVLLNGAGIVATVPSATFQAGDVVNICVQATAGATLRGAAGVTIRAGNGLSVLAGDVALNNNFGTYSLWFQTATVAWLAGR